ITRAILIGVLGGAGVATFLLWCHFELGQWDAPIQVCRDGWNIQPNYLSLFSAGAFRVGRPNLDERAIDPMFLNRLSIPLTLVLFAVVGLLELWLARTHPGSGWRERLGFYLCAGLLFYVSVSLQAAQNGSSLLRASLGVHVLFILAVVHLLTRLWPLRR